MLGEIIAHLTDPAMGKEAISIVAAPELAERIQQAADAAGLQVGVLVAKKVRQVVDHGGDDLWLDLLGVMSASPQPGAAAVERILRHAFPDTARVRITHHTVASHA